MSIQNKRLSPFYSLLLIVPLLIMSSLLLPFVGIILPQEKQSAGQYITSLRDPDLDTNPLPQSGIYRNKDSQNSPYYSITEIEPDKAIYFPEETISVANRFNSAQTGSYAIVSQVIYLYLNSSTITNLSDTTHLIATTVTNGTHPEDYPAISDDQTYGMIDVTFTIPEMTNLTDRYGISPGDNVSIFQYYPGGSTNTTAKIENVVAFAKIDYFTVSGFSTLAETNPGFINSASGDETFRQGEEASVVLTAQSGTTPLSGLIVDVQLHDGTTHALISNGGPQGISYNLLDMSSGLPSTSTDVNGELRLNVTTTYPTTPENDYYFILNTTIDTADGFTENFDGSNNATNYADSTANFTILNELDFVTIPFINATNQNPPDYLDPPNNYSTIVLFRIQAQYAYGTPTYYYPQNIPVNATFEQPPSGGVTLAIADGFFNNGSSDWALSNSDGYVAFNITADFPVMYLDIIQNINVFADLTSNSVPIYPPTNLAHRYMRNPSLGLITEGSRTISIHPDFWVGEIVFSSDNTSVGTIQPGQSAVLEFEVRSSNDTTNKFSGVPVNISLGIAIPGITLIPNSVRNSPFLLAPGYFRTDGTGIIEITVKSTYLLTPEVLQSITLIIRADFENDSQDRWIGDENAITIPPGSLAQFTKSWRTESYTGLSIDPDFTTYEVILSATSEFGDTVIRPDDVLDVSFRVQSEVGGLGLAGVNVNVVLHDSYSGVFLVYIVGPNTNTSGYITVRITTTHLITPKILNIVLNVTADLTSDPEPPGRWLVGQETTNPSFYSNSSYSEVQSTISVDPQYFFGEITAPSANNPIFRIGQSEWINITFRLYLSGVGTVFPDIDAVNISITVDENPPGDSNMTVVPVSSFQDSIGSWVTFSLQTTGTTEEKWYTVNATAYFGDAQGLLYNISHSSVPSGELAGVWVNGSHTQDISFTTFDFEVKNVDRVQVLIQDSVNDITDGTHSDVGLNVSTGFYEIYRGTTSINISGSYYDPVAGKGLNSTTVRISFNTTIAPQTFTLADVVTDANGGFWTIITIPTSIPLQDISIYGWDPTFPTPKENRNPITNIRLMSRVFIPNHALSGYNGNAIFVGESVTSTGTVRDDQGAIVDSTQFISLIENIGWDSTQEVGTAISGSLSSGSFSLDYQIPNDYALNVIAIRAKVIWGAGLVNYRPRIFQLWINIYDEISISSFAIYLPANRSTIPIINDSTYNILGDSHRQIYISGNLVDQFPRGLNGKDINEAWNGTGVTITSGGGGFFNLSYDFTGFTNVTWIWSFSHTLDNGTTLPTTFIVTFNWIAIDDTSPDITIVAPANVAWLQTVVLANISTTTILVDVFDPDMGTGPGYVSLGLNTSSITITINDTSVPMINLGGSRYTYEWDTSNVNDTVFFISITGLDFANNLGNFSFYAVIDIILPMATISVPSTTVLTIDYATMNPNGDIVITGDLYDFSSITSRNSGIDNTSIQLIIRPQGGATVLTVYFGDLNASSTSFNYNWSIFNSTTLTRIPLFNTPNTNWELVVRVTDYAGNINQTILTVVLENDIPAVSVVSEPPSQITGGTLEFIITYYDLKSGINENFSRFVIYDADDDTLLRIYDFNSSEVTLIDDSNASLTLDANDLNDGHYLVRITVFDNVGNSGTVDSDDFNILLPVTTTTTPPSTTTTSPSDPGVLRPIDLIQFLLLDIIALGSGIGIAVIFERVKSRRKA